MPPLFITTQGVFKTNRTLEAVAITKKTELEILDGGNQRGFALLNPDTMKRLDAEIGSIVLFEDPHSSFWGAAEVRKNENLENDKIEIDSLVLEASLLMEGDVVEVQLYEEDMIALEYVEFGLKPLSEDANTE
ncbi:hypothetical protein EU545_04600, partial [Candidatus Thorarchaeota archaeon]